MRDKKEKQNEEKNTKNKKEGKKKRKESKLKEKTEEKRSKGEGKSKNQKRLEIIRLRSFIAITGEEVRMGGGLRKENLKREREKTNHGRVGDERNRRKQKR